MKFAKYNSAKEGAAVVVGGSSSSSSNNSSDTTTEIGTRSGGGSRILWGNYDDGENINESMKVLGNIYIQKSGEVPDEDDDDEDEEKSWDDDNEEEFNFDWDDDAEGGKLVVENKVTTKDADVMQDLKVGRHLFIKHSHSQHNTAEVCVSELIKDCETNISNNTTEIGNIKNRVSTNETNISNNTTEINKLKSSNLTTEDVLQLIRDNQPSVLGSYNQPVILFSGRARRVSYYTDKYYIEGIKLPHFELSNSIEQGLMTITITPADGYSVRVYAVHATQERSGDTGDTITAYHKGRSDGAHWFECRVDSLTNTSKVYVKEFHQGNGDNDTWYSDAWFEEGGIKAINLTLIGFIVPPSA